MGFQDIVDIGKLLPIPGVRSVCSAISALDNVRKGDWTGAGLDILGAVPIAGDFARFGAAGRGVKAGLEKVGGGVGRVVGHEVGPMMGWLLRAGEMVKS